VRVSRGMISTFWLMDPSVRGSAWKVLYVMAGEHYCVDEVLLRTEDLLREREEPRRRLESPVERVGQVATEFKMLLLVFSDRNMGSSVRK